jgi:tetratricopeptide (TPR) repeat protein
VSANSLVEEGNALYRKGDLQGAIGCYEAAVRADPADDRARYNLGVVLQGLSRLDEAVAQYRQVAAGSAEFPKALVNWANALKDRNDLRGAADLYERAHAANPADPAILKNLARLGDLALHRREHEQALQLYGRVAKLGSADGLAGLGTVALEAGDPAKAIEHFRAALAIEPRHSAAHYNFGVALDDLQRFDEALEHFERAAAIDPRNAGAWVRWGEALRRRGDAKGAAERFARALEMDPANAAALNNLATAALDDGDVDGAAALLERLAASHPELEEPRFNLGLVALNRQRFAEGWEANERRFRILTTGVPAPLAGLPRFELDESARGKRVAVLREQGLGDQILFSTLLSELTARGIRGVVEVDPRLAGAYARSLPDLEFVTSAAQIADCDAQIPLGSLPRLFRRDVASFRRQPKRLFAADGERVAALARRLPAGRRIGIAWRTFQGAARQNVELRKSAALARFAPLAVGARLIDLQYGDVREERAAFDRSHPGVRTEVEGLDLFNDLEGVLAAIELCDLVVTTSNVTAHLAGAVGKRTWLVYLRANAPFHYWAPDASGRSLWYPSVEICTDRAWSTWEAAFDAIALRLVNELFAEGNALRDRGDFAGAIAAYGAIAAAHPRLAEPLVNWGNILYQQNDPSGAARLYERALAANPAQPQALNNLAGILLDRGEIAGARAAFERANAAKPGDADALYNLGLIALREHDFSRGWDAYELRFQSSPPVPVTAPGNVPPLEPADLARGHRVAIWSEQGVGDQILYSTLLPELAERRLDAVVEVDRRLVEAYRRSLPKLDFVATDARDRAFDDCDRHLAIGSLPRLFRPSVESFSRQTRALLAPDAARARAIAAKLPAGVKVGISWRSFQPADRRNFEVRKSIPLECFAALDGAALVDLQYGDVRAEREAFDARHPGKRRAVAGLDVFNDLEGLLAAIASCDLVITASNVTAHLAGAIGKPTWLVYLGANAPFHYWVPGPGGRALWYPSVEIVSDRDWSTWEAAFEGIAARWRRR